MEQMYKLKRHFTRAKVKSTAFAHRRGVPRRKLKSRRTPMRREIAQILGCFGGFWGKNKGTWEAQKAPRGGVSPVNQGRRVAGRSRLYTPEIRNQR